MPKEAFACLFLDSISGQARSGAIVFLHGLAWAGFLALSVWGFLERVSESRSATPA